MAVFACRRSGEEHACGLFVLRPACRCSVLWRKLRALRVGGELVPDVSIFCGWAQAEPRLGKRAAACCWRWVLGGSSSMHEKRIFVGVVSVAGMR